MAHRKYLVPMQSPPIKFHHFFFTADLNSMPYGLARVINKFTKTKNISCGKYTYIHCIIIIHDPCHVY